MSTRKLSLARLTGTAALVAGLLLAGACGGPGAGGPSDPSGGPSQDAADAQSINPQDRSALQQGGRVRLAISDFGTNWNPKHVDGNNADISDVRDPIFPSAMDYDASGKPTPNPEYLESAEVTQEDPTVVSLKLNPKAVWGDGEPIDADDWIATLLACGPDKKNGNNCASRDGFELLESVKAGADQNEVIVSFTGPYPDWAKTVGTVYRAESMNTPAAFNKGWSDISAKPEWLSGPFKIKSYDKTQKVMTEVPNDKWWGEKPLLDEVTFRAISSDATASAFVNDEIDAFDVGPDPDANARAQGAPNAEVRRAGGPDYRHFTFNQKAGLMTDQAIRQAIVRGLNRTEIAASDLAGLDWPAESKNHNLFNANQEGYRDIAQETGLDYDPEKAKADLEAAGWKDADGDGIREKDGKKLTVKFSQLAGVPVSENEAKQTQAQLKIIGIDVQIVVVPIAKFQDGSVLSGGEFEIIAFSWIGTPYPYGSISQIFGTGSDSNYSKVSIPRVDEIAKEASFETDPAKRIELAAEASKLMWESVCTLPLYQRPELVAAKKSLANYGAFGMGTTDWENIGYLK